MEMTIPQVASPAPAASASTGAQAKTSNSDKFQKTLSAQMKSDKTSSDKKDATTAASTAKPSDQTPVSTEQGTGEAKAAVADQLPANDASAEAGIVATDPDALTDAAASLMDIIDQMLADLEKIKSDSADAAADEQTQDMQELSSMLDQLQALLALLGIPVAAGQQTQANPWSNEDAIGTANPSDQMSALVSKVQDSLLQLQTAMQEGTMKQIGLQEPMTLIGQQLQALQQFVAKHKETNVRLEQQKTSGDKAPDITVTTTAPAVSVHLQRLSEKAVHPATLAAQASQQATQEEAEVSPETSEQTAPTNAGPTFTEVFRQTGPQAAKLAPTVQANVPVSEFADSMKDFIQKLDIKHGNGMSEAVIQLFPKELGQVDVRISMHNGQLTAMFHADNANAKDALDNQMAQLRVALQQQGLSVDKLEVTYSQTAAQLSNGQHGQGTGQQAFSQSNKSKGDGLQEEFESDIAEQQAIQDLGYGRAVNTTA